jgi:copper(I)-binding protein
MKNILLASLLSIATTSVLAQASIENPWARATVPGQPVGAVYMTISSPTKVTLVQAETDAAKQVQVHTMHTHDGVMKMREHGEIHVEPGKPVELAPGGMHFMLIGLKSPLVAGETVDLKLTFKDHKGTTNTTTVSAPIRPFGK